MRTTYALYFGSLLLVMVLGLCCCEDTRSKQTLNQCAQACNATKSTIWWSNGSSTCLCTPTPAPSGSAP